MHRILHITTVHPRDDVRIFLKECLFLSRSGYEVHLIVGDGMGDGEVDGIIIHDIGARPKSRMQRFWFQTRKAYKKAIALHPQIVHFHDPELLPLGRKLMQKGMRVIYDVHEDLPREKLHSPYIPKLLRPAVSIGLEIYENRAAKRLTGLVAATSHIAQRFLKQGMHVIDIHNYPILGELQCKAERSLSNRICFIGCLSRERGLMPLIRALPLVPEVRLTLCGLFSEQDFERELRHEPGWAQVDYLGQVDRKTVARVMSESCAGIVTFLQIPSHVEAQPNKLFEYMSAGLPVIGSHFPLWKKLIEDTGVGMCVDPSSSREIAQAIHAVFSDPVRAKNMGDTGRYMVLNQYNWASEFQKLKAFYESIV